MDQLKLFNLVKNHLLTQNARSVNEVGQCMYRGENGLKCAVGALIKDEYYDPKYEKLNIHSLLVQGSVSLSLGEDLTQENLSMLNSLQYIHDRTDTVDWAFLLDRVERVYVSGDMLPDDFAYTERMSFLV